MKKIPSFTIDHIHLLRGIYVSRKDYLGDHVVTTFDIRMKEPNREPAIGYGALHTIEHLAATFLRNHPVWGDKIVFWGPMGCCTGNYFLVQGDLQSRDIVDLMRETFRFIRDFEGQVPGAAPRDCGNYLLHDLPMARWEADKYLREVLDVIEEKNLVYPTVEEYPTSATPDRHDRKNAETPIPIHPDEPPRPGLFFYLSRGHKKS